MVNKILSEGDKIDIKNILNSTQKNDGIEPNVYASQVLDMSRGERIRIAMPFTQGRLVPLSKGVEYDAFFYASKGIYHSRIVVVERYKTGNVYSMEIDFVTPLTKQQRRQYYRLEKNVSIEYCQIPDLMGEALLNGQELTEEMINNSVYFPGETLDISGGGMRYIGRNLVEKGHVVLVKLSVSVDKKIYDFVLPAKVVMSFSLDKPGSYEHRIEFINMKNTIRDVLVRYIFEEERKLRSRNR